MGGVATVQSTQVSAAQLQKQVNDACALFLDLVNSNLEKDAKIKALEAKLAAAQEETSTKKPKDGE
jgi:hypothetical protein